MHNYIYIQIYIFIHIILAVHFRWQPIKIIQTFPLPVRKSHAPGHLASTNRATFFATRNLPGCKPRVGAAQNSWGKEGCLDHHFMKKLMKKIHFQCQFVETLTLIYMGICFQEKISFVERWEHPIRMVSPILPWLNLVTNMVPQSLFYSVIGK